MRDGNFADRAVSVLLGIIGVLFYGLYWILFGIFKIFRRIAIDVSKHIYGKIIAVIAGLLLLWLGLSSLVG